MDSIAELGGGTHDQMIATDLILLLIFIPYFAFRSFGEIIGDGILVRLYFEMSSLNPSFSANYARVVHLEPADLLPGVLVVPKQPFMFQRRVVPTADRR
jgi:hypothetical protein